MTLVRLVIILLAVPIMSCGMSRQYTAPYGPDGSAKGKVASVGVEGCFTCWGQGQGDVTYSEVKFNVGSSSRCMMIILGIPTGWGECDRSNPSHSDGYWVNVRIENTSNYSIGFSSDRIVMKAQGSNIPYELQALQNTSQKDHINYLSNDNDVVKEIPPGDIIYFRLFIGPWNSIQDEFQIDFSEALKTKDKINIHAKRLTATRFGLIGLH